MITVLTEQNERPVSELNKQTETATVPPALHHCKNPIGFARFAEVVLGSLEVGSLRHLLLHTGYAYYERYDDLYSPQHMTASSVNNLVSYSQYYVNTAGWRRGVVVSGVRR